MDKGEASAQLMPNKLIFFTKASVPKNQGEEEAGEEEEVLVGEGKEEVR